MKLNEYGHQTLLDITEGVGEAQKEALLPIAPGTVKNEAFKTPSLIKFEVIGIVKKDFLGGIRVWSVGDIKAGDSSEQTNRISFDVPAYFLAPTLRNENHHANRIKVEGAPE